MKNTYPTHHIALRVLTLLILSVSLEGASARETSESAHPRERNLRPVIGIFSQDTDTITGSSTIDPEVKEALSAYRYMIPASYVNWVGQAGGRTLPILLDQPDEYYQEVFSQTNGILFPGGNQGIDPSDIYTEEGEILWNLAKQANDRGDYYPIWGTCLGFEDKLSAIVIASSFAESHCFYDTGNPIRVTSFSHGCLQPPFSSAVSSACIVIFDPIQRNGSGGIQFGMLVARSSLHSGRSRRSSSASPSLAPKRLAETPKPE
jgi:hypothetical protein